jgi:hypothetical protein
VCSSAGLIDYFFQVPLKIIEVSVRFMQQQSKSLHHEKWYEEVEVIKEKQLL